jgi:hypothetical protein
MADHKHYDIADNPIYPESFVIYAALWDRSATLKYGIVTRLAEKESPGYLRRENEKYTVRLLTVDRDYDRKWEVQKDGNEVALGFLDRMLVVPKDRVPDGAKKVLLEAFSEFQRRKKK